MNRMVKELLNRDITRVAAAYVAFAWAGIQVLDTIGPMIGTPEWLDQATILTLLAGFPIAVFVAWTFKVTVR